MERQVCAEEGYAGLQENHWSQADECCHAEEIVGNDEGAVGSEERVESLVQDLKVAVRRLVYSRLPVLPALVHTATQSVAHRESDQQCLPRPSENTRVARRVVSLQFPSLRSVSERAR